MRSKAATPSRALPSAKADRRAQGSGPPVIVRLAAVLSSICFCSSINAQSTAPSTQQAVGPAALSPAEVQTLDQAELHSGSGDPYLASDVPKYQQAHELIEQFFKQPEQRQQTIDELTKTQFTPDVLGRLTMIRTHWAHLEPGVYYINERVGTNVAAYFLGIPDKYEPVKAWPLVIELPTASAFATNPKPDADRVTQVYTAWITAELAKHPAAIVLMPLLNLTSRYGPLPEGINNVIAPLQHTQSVVHVDPSRVYLSGFAMSSLAAWDIALHQATYFAAFDAFAGTVRGDWQRLRVMNLRNTLPVIWQDDDDPVASVGAARQIVDAMRRLSCDVDYEQTHSLGHVPSPALIDERYDTMLKRVRDLYPRRITLQSDRIEPVYNRLDWIRIDQWLQPGKQRRLLLEDGSGRLTLNGNTAKVDATLDRPNHFTVVTDNVASFRIFLNDQLIDYSKPITVVVNGRGRFEDLVTPTIREMLMDQLTLGRGWRCFTGHIDIDLTAAR